MEGKAAISKNKAKYERKKRGNNGNENDDSWKKSKRDAKISSAVEKEIARRLDKSAEAEKREARDQEEVRNYIMSVVQDSTKPGKKVTFAAEAATTDAGPPVLSTTLKRILGQK